MRHFRGRSLQGKGSRSGIRVIYAHSRGEGTDDKVLLIEVYYKGNKDSEDRARIMQYLQGKGAL